MKIQKLPIHDSLVDINQYKCGVPLFLEIISFFEGLSGAFKCLQGSACDLGSFKRINRLVTHCTIGQRNRFKVTIDSDDNSSSTEHIVDLNG